MAAAQVRILPGFHFTMQCRHSLSFGKDTVRKDSKGKKTSELNLKWRLDISQVAKVTAEQSELIGSIEELEKKTMPTLSSFHRKQ